MSELTRFRDHCAAMSAAEHKPECEWPSRGAVEAHNRQAAMFEHLFGEPDGTRGRATHCLGCVTASDRALFALLAAEVDDYLAPQPDLFGEMTAEPTPSCGCPDHVCLSAGAKGCYFGVATPPESPTAPTEEGA